jgi:4-hydroxythreonine-4-phosphate dehydrogenase
MSLRRLYARHVFLWTGKTMSLPVIGITMGDPVGIGSEIILKALAQREVFARSIPLVFVDGPVLEETNKLLGSP